MSDSLRPSTRAARAPEPGHGAAARTEDWVIWNGTLGVAATVALGRVELAESGRVAWLDKPFEMAGPFSLDALEQYGRITFAACVVMSRERWRLDQDDLRREAREKRRDQQERQRRRHGSSRAAGARGGDDRRHRAALDLPAEGKLASAQIKAAFRKLARQAHPDAGGSHEHFLRITEARDALLEGRA
jgi:hypothetical protein